jgi:cholesterol transport system auxiliary component
MMARVLTSLTCAGLLVTLSGCTGLFHSTARPEQVYFLRAAAATGVDGAAGTPQARPALTASIRIARPTPAPGLDSSHIVLLESDRRMSYYMASRWPAPLPEMVEELALQALMASASWSAVQGSASQFPTDYVLQIRIRDFEADYGETAGTGANAIAPEVHVALECTVGRRSGRDVIATFLVEGSAKADSNRLAQVVAAFEQATSVALASMSTRTVDAVHARPAQ